MSKHIKKQKTKHPVPSFICFRKVGLKPKLQISDFLGLLERGKKRPDLTKEKIELVEMYCPGDDWQFEFYSLEPLFADISPYRSVLCGWFANISEYEDFAWLEFSRRNPKHILAKKFRKAYRFSKKQVDDFISGKKSFRVRHIRGSTIIQADRS